MYKATYRLFCKQTNGPNTNLQSNNYKSINYRYTADTSKVVRKMSGEFAERILIREHKRIPKFDNANLEVSKVYNMNNKISNQYHKKLSKKFIKQNADENINENTNYLKHNQDDKKKTMLGGLIIKAGLDYLYPKDTDVLYGMLLTNKKLLGVKPDAMDQWREIGKNLKNNT